MRWTAEEEETLRAGVARHKSKWKTIQQDSDFNPILHNRTPKQMKDKWRNMNKSDKKQLLDTDKDTDVDVAAPNANATSSSTDHPSISDSAMTEDLDKLCRNKDVEPAPEQMPMQTASHETLASADETTVASRGAEPENEDQIVASAFQESEKLEIIKDLDTLGMDEPALEQRLMQDFPEIIEAAAETAARLNAEAESRERLAALAVRQAEIISKMAEHAEAMLQLDKLMEHCELNKNCDRKTSGS